MQAETVTFILSCLWGVVACCPPKKQLNVFSKRERCCVSVCLRASHSSCCHSRHVFVSPKFARLLSPSGFTVALACDCFGSNEWLGAHGLLRKSLSTFWRRADSGTGFLQWNDKRRERGRKGWESPCAAFIPSVWDFLCLTKFPCK